MSHDGVKNGAPNLTETFLRRAGTSDSSTPSDWNGWGFPSAVYSAQRLCEEEELSQSSQGYLAVLLQSRTFLSPDCTEAMAGGLRVLDLFKGLRGSLMRPAPTEEQVQELRAHVRQRVRSAWSQEAVRRGVGHAKAGELEQALACYGQALELDERNTDALVARGAALANAHDFERARADLEAALLLQADHQNAAAYLEAVKRAAPHSGGAGAAREGPGVDHRPGVAGAEAPPDQQLRGQRHSPAASVRPLRQQQQRDAPSALPNRLAEGGNELQQQQQLGTTMVGSRPSVELSPPAVTRGRHSRKRSRSRSPRRRSSSTRRHSRSSSEAPSCNSGGPASSSEDGELRGGAAAGRPGGGTSMTAPVGEPCNAPGMDMEQALTILTKHYKRSRNVALQAAGAVIGMPIQHKFALSEVLVKHGKPKRHRHKKHKSKHKKTR